MTIDVEPGSYTEKTVRQAEEMVREAAYETSRLYANLVDAATFIEWASKVISAATITPPYGSESAACAVTAALTTDPIIFSKLFHQTGRLFTALEDYIGLNPDAIDESHYAGINSLRRALSGDFTAD